MAWFLGSDAIALSVLISVFIVQDVNEEWISDKARFCYDGLKCQRLNEPMIRGASGHLEAASWYNALRTIAAALSKTPPERMAGIAGKLSDAESMMALKDLLNRLGCDNLRCEGDGLQPNADIRSDYLMNTTISGLEKADVCLLIGTQVFTFTNGSVRMCYPQSGCLILLIDQHNIHFQFQLTVGHSKS